MCLTVQLANPRAVRLYQQMGFRIVRQQMRNASNIFPAEPEYFMSRKTIDTDDSPNSEASRPPLGAD